MIISEKVISQMNGLVYYKLHFETDSKNDITETQYYEIMSLIENYLFENKEKVKIEFIEPEKKISLFKKIINSL